MSKCDNCSKSITKALPGVECSKCERVVHLSSKCTGLTNKQLSALKAASPGLGWTCLECLKESSRRNSSIIIPEDEDEDSDNHQTLPIDAGKLLKEISKEVEKTIKKELKDISESMLFHSAKLDEVMECMETFKQTIKILEKKNIELTNKNNNLETRIGALEQQIQQMEQGKLSTFIEIVNIPFNKDENVENLVNKVALKLKLCNTSIKHSRRLRGKTGQDGNIQVELKEENAQQEWLTAAKTSTVKVSDICPQDTSTSNNNIVYIREKMTPLNKQILWLAKQELKLKQKFKKLIPLHIIEEDSYEKDVLFYVNLGEPELLGEVFETFLPDVAANVSVEFSPDDDNPVVPGNEVNHLATLPEEEAAVAMMGLPRAGEITRAQLRIKESKEFKNTVDKLVQRANASIIIGTSSWREQFAEALTASSGSDDPDEPPSWSDYVMHVITLFWKIIFAFVPPTDIGGGYVCFVVSIICIGLVTAVIGDVASHFGCTLGIKDSVTAIVFVALGTSIPDTFASKVAAIQDKYADASVGNVTGSNAVNVFLGIGVAWTLAAIIHWSKGEKFLVDPGNLAFSVTMFCSEAALAVLVLVLRRRKSIGGELGGPKRIKIITSMFFFSLWLVYLTMSSLEAYDVIQGF